MYVCISFRIHIAVREGLWLCHAGTVPGILKPMAVIDEISSKGRIFHPGSRR